MVASITIESRFLSEQFLALFMEFLYPLSRVLDRKFAGLKRIFPTLKPALQISQRRSDRLVLRQGLVSSEFRALSITRRI